MKPQTEVELIQENPSNWDVELKKINVLERERNVSKRAIVTNGTFVVAGFWILCLMILLMFCTLNKVVLPLHSYLIIAAITTLISRPLMCVFRYLFEFKSL